MKDSKLIGAGSFKVDRDRALDKLMRFQLPDATLFVLPLVRCAVAAGASSVSISATGGQVSVRFDGRPFSEAELQDPYGCLFDRHAPENRPHRELAIALLSALRLEPSSISLLSGPPGRRFHLQVWSPVKETLEASDSQSQETTVSVRIGIFAVKALLPRLFPFLERCPVPLIVEGTPRAGPDDPDGQFFQSAERRGWVGVPADISTESPLTVHCLGVKVAPVRVVLRGKPPEVQGVQAEGWVDDPQFTLNASQTGVARNARFNAAVEDLSRAAKELLGKTARRQRERLKPLGPILLEGWRNRNSASLEGWHYYWQYRLDKGSIWDQPGFWLRAAAPVNEIIFPALCRHPSRHRETIAAIRREARATAWLRETAAGLLTDPDKQGGQPLLRDLWEAPLFFGVDGAPLSALELRDQRLKLGYIPASRDPSPDKDWPFSIVWLASDSDEAVLRRLFGDDVRDLTATIRKLVAPAPEKNAAPTLSAAGVSGLLARKSFSAGDFQGEVGLSSQPHQSSARVHVFARGLPAGFTPLETGLRFEAAVELGSATKNAEAAREPLLAAAHALYELVSIEYSPGGGGAREAAVREHLLDYLSFHLKRRTDVFTAAAWLLDCPLLEINGRWVSLRAVRALLAEGDSIAAPGSGEAPALTRPRYALSGSRWTENLLRLAFPEARLLPHAVPGGGLLVFRPLPLAELPASPMDYPKGDDGVRFNLLIALLEQRGTFHNEPDSPHRAYLVARIREFLVPWGIEPARMPLTLWNKAERLRHLRELLEALPFFRAPGRPGVSLHEIDSLLGGGGRLRWGPPGESGSRPPTDAVLSPSELELVNSLWPAYRNRIVPAAEAAAPKAPNIEAGAPRGPSPVAAPEFKQSMLFLRRYQYQGLDIVLGLPAKPGNPVFFFLHQGRRFDLPAVEDELPSILVAAVDASKLPAVAAALSGKAPDARKALAACKPLVETALTAFYGEFIKEWPLEDPSGTPNLAAALSLIRLTLALRRHHSPEGDALLARIFRLKLFRTLGGGRTDLESLAASSRGGVLKYAPRPIPLSEPEAAEIPILSSPAARIVAKLLGENAPITLIVYRPPAKPAPAAAPEPPPPPPPPLEADPSDPLAQLAKILGKLKGRRGVILNAPRSIPNRALFKRALESSLPPEARAAYLASILSSFANRESAPYSDLDDQNFQQALARELSGPAPQTWPT